MKKTIEKIRITRLAKGYTQDYMSEKLDINQRTYSKLERGLIELTIKRLKAIAKILEIDVKELIE